MGIANAHRETSHSAYLEIEDNGQLRDMKRKVFRCLSENPPLTGREVDERLGVFLGVALGSDYLNYGMQGLLSKWAKENAASQVSLPSSGLQKLKCPKAFSRQERVR